MMEIEVNAKKKVNVAVIKTHIKVCDRFTASIVDSDGNEVKELDGYVPGFFPGQHYGDYLYLDIDLATGQILNWKAPTAAQLTEAIDGDDEE